MKMKLIFKKNKKTYITIVLIFCLIGTLILSIFNNSNYPIIDNVVFPYIDGSLFNNTINGYDGTFDREKFMKEFKNTYESMTENANVKFQYYFHDDKISIRVIENQKTKEYTYIKTDNFIL